MRYLTIYENFSKITFDISNLEYEYIFDECCQGVDLNNDVPIYRSVNGELHEDYYLIDPRKYDRTSANTNNYYTLIMDNEKEWKRFPKRKHGIICSLNESYMGDEYRVVPLLEWSSILNKYGIKEFKNPKWGMCNDIDIWHSFIKLSYYQVGGQAADDFNYLIQSIYRSVNDTSNALEQENYEKFKEELTKITYEDLYKLMLDLDSPLSDVRNVSDKEDFKLNVNLMKKNSLNNLYELLKYMYSPDGFELYTYKSLQKNCNTKMHNEIWTDKPVLYILKV